MRSFAAPHAFICGPLKSGLWRLRFRGPEMNSWGGCKWTLDVLSICSVLWNQIFFLLGGASNELLKMGRKWAVWGGPNELSSILYIYIYIYIYMLLCSILGCFFSPNAFENAPGYAFENGVRSVRGREIPVFTVFRGFRKGSSYRNRPFKYATSSRGNMLNMRHLPRKTRTMTPRPTPSVQTSMRFAVVRRGQTCPELRGEWVFRVRGLEISMERPKTRDLEKWQNIFVLARPSSFCAFSWRAWLSPKTGFSKSTNFRWNHWKRSAKRSRCENPFLHGRVWNRPS